MKQAILILGLVLHALFSFSQNDTVIIRGKVHSGNIKKVYVECLVNPIIARYQPYFAPVNSQSEFILKIPLSRIASGRITAGNFHHDICLLPSDNFYTDIDADTILYTGKGADKNNFLYFLERSAYSNENFYNDLGEGKLSLKDFALKMAKIRDKRIELLNNYSKDHEIEPEYKALFLIDNQVMYRDILLKYPQRFSSINNIKEDSLKLVPEYYKCRQLSNIVDEEYVISFNYIFSLTQFLSTKVQDLKGVKIDTTVKKYSFNSFRETIWEYILMIDSLKGKTQEYVMACWLCLKLEMSNELDTIIYNEFKKRAKDQVAIDVVNNTIDKLNLKRSLGGKPLIEEFIQTQLNDTTGRTLTFGDLIGKFNGKVVYLDIWGLSCAPCRAAMPYSRKMRDKLSGKPIEFVFFTIEDMDKKRWDQAFKITQTKNNHYQLVDGWNSEFLNFMEVNWIPYYMIIDKDGNLVDYNAKHPSDEVELEKQLTELAERN